MRRRRVAITDKDLPPVSVVRERMAAIQQVIEDGGYEPCDIISADETGIFFGAQPKNQYVPEGARRGSAPGSNDMARFTAMMWGTADGTMQAPFIIIKCTVKGPDLCSSRVLGNLMLTEGFHATNGWTKEVWTRSITLTVRGREQVIMYRRPYLVHRDGCVITVHHNAWMDSAGLAMWADVQVGPWATANGGNKLIVWDNCGPHGVAAVGAVFGERGIRTEALPPRMTSRLQVMDLVVNGPLKPAIRRGARCRVDQLPPGLEVPAVRGATQGRGEALPAALCAAQTRPGRRAAYAVNGV
jgi:hypothetical protein